MLVSILTNQLGRMRHSLRHRGLWPIPPSEGYDLTDPEVRAELHSLSQVAWPIAIPPAWSARGNTPPAGSDVMRDALHEYLKLGNDFILAAGLAKPDRVWITRVKGGYLRRPIPDIRGCTRLEYMELEEVIAQLRQVDGIPPQSA